MKQFILNALIQWATSLVPCLLPIMIISRLLIGSSVVYLLLRPFSFLCKKLLHLSPSGSYALMLGFCCGYPMGVKTLADLHSAEAIDLEEGRYLAGFINNVSPGFLIACVCHDLLNAPGFVFPCMVMVYGAALCYGVGMQVVRGRYREVVQDSQKTDFDETHHSGRKVLSSKTNNPHYKEFTLHNAVPHSKKHASFLALLDAAIEDSITQMLKICGYMVLFAVLSFFVCQLPGLPALPKAFLVSILEISLGCRLLAGLSCSLFWKYLLIIVALTFGGLCSAFQSAAFLKKLGIPLQKYIKIKAMTAVIALGFFLIYLLPSIGIGILA